MGEKVADDRMCVCVQIGQNRYNKTVEGGRRRRVRAKDEIWGVRLPSREIGQAFSLTCLVGSRSKKRKKSSGEERRYGEITILVLVWGVVENNLVNAAVGRKNIFYSKAYSTATEQASFDCASRPC